MTGKLEGPNTDNVITDCAYGIFEFREDLGRITEMSPEEARATANRFHKALEAAERAYSKETADRLADAAISIAVLDKFWRATAYRIGRIGAARCAIGDYSGAIAVSELRSAVGGYALLGWEDA